MTMRHRPRLFVVVVVAACCCTRRNLSRERCLLVEKERALFGGTNQFGDLVGESTRLFVCPLVWRGASSSHRNGFTLSQECVCVSRRPTGHLGVTANLYHPQVHSSPLAYLRGAFEGCSSWSNDSLPSCNLTSATLRLMHATCSPSAGSCFTSHLWNGSSYSSSRVYHYQRPSLPVG